jgi:hypothetical protein
MRYDIGHKETVLIIYFSVWAYRSFFCCCENNGQQIPWKFHIAKAKIIIVLATDLWYNKDVTAGA